MLRTVRNGLIAVALAAAMEAEAAATAQLSRCLSEKRAAAAAAAATFQEITAPAAGEPKAAKQDEAGECKQQ